MISASVAPLGRRIISRILAPLLSARGAPASLRGALAGFLLALASFFGAALAVFLVDFITERLGPHFYNQGLYDAQAILAKKTDEIGEAILGADKPVKA